MIEHLPPGLILMLGALLVPLLPRRAMGAFMLALPLLGLWQLWQLPEGHTVSFTLMGYPLVPVRVDRLSRIFGTIFQLNAVLAITFALHVKDRVQHVASLLYMGSAVAAVFAGDLITLFICWEVTAATSVFLIWARRTERSYKAGMRYLIIQVSSGLLLLAGAVIHYTETGSIAFGDLGLGGLGTTLIFVAFGIKAAFPLLHNWLEDAYPEATVTGTVFLSAYTTKLAIYALARGYAGTEILIPIGAAMTAIPIFFAVIENDLRRVLTYSLNNQLGFMIVGIGIGTELSINGTCAHAFAHILYKSVLFMSMGAVLHRAGTINGTDLGGLYKRMPWTTAFCIIGAASISAFPLTSGFVTKSMIMSAAAQGHHTITYLIMLFASAGVFHHSGIKIPFFAFYGHDHGIGQRENVTEAPLNMLLAMGAVAFLCLAIGAFPGPLYSLLPYPVTYQSYTVSHVVTQLQLLLFSALAFGVLQKTGIYPPELRSTNLDFDWTYRKAIPWLLARITGPVAHLLRAVERTARGSVAAMLSLAGRYFRPPGLFGEPWPTGKSTLLAVILLALYLVLYFH